MFVIGFQSSWLVPPLQLNFVLTWKEQGVGTWVGLDCIVTAAVVNKHAESRAEAASVM